MPLITYIIVILTPKTHRKRATAIWFIKGDVIRKENVTPRGIPHLRNQINNGTDEQVQKGVIEPNNEAKRCSNPNIFF